MIISESIDPSLLSGAKIALNQTPSPGKLARICSISESRVGDVH